MQVQDYVCYNYCLYFSRELQRYCYVEFGDPLSAQGALNALNNKPVPGTAVRDNSVYCIGLYSSFVSDMSVYTVHW